MAVATVSSGDEVQSAHHNALAGLINGTANSGNPVLFYQYDNSANYSLTVGNQDTTNGYALKVQYGTVVSPTTVATFGKTGVDVPLPFRARGSGAAGTNGLWVDANGRIGLIDQATGSTLSTNSSIVATKTAATNEVFADFQSVCSYPGAQVTTGTASSGGATTLVQSGAGWTVNAYAGKIVHLLTGTGASVADPYRYVSSNTSDTLTVSLAWTTNPGAGTTFEIVTPGDMGAGRFLMNCLAGNVASRRALEAHAYAVAGTADSGLVAIETSIGSNVAQWSTTNNVGISLLATAAFLGSSGVEQGTGIRVWGDLGWTRYLVGTNSSATEEILLRKGGHIEHAGNLTVGTTTAGTPRLFVKQSANSISGGVQVQESGAATQNGYLYAGPSASDPAVYLQSSKSGTGSVILRVGADPADVGLKVTGNNTQSGDMLQAVVNGSTVWSVTAAGLMNWITGNSGTGAGGGAATLGNVSASASTGPTTTARSEWAKITLNGSTRWLAVWT